MSSSFEIIREFPTQFVIAPYLSSDSMRNTIIKPANWHDLINWEGTRFWQKALPLIGSNVDQVRDAVEEFGFKENDIRREKELWLKNVVKGFSEMKSVFDKNEIKALRSGKYPYSQDLAFKVLAVSHSLYEGNPYRDGVVLSFEDRVYTPLYRFLLGWVVLFLRYLENNINDQYPTSRIHNDLNDAYIAAQATFTHSMFTGDKGTQYLYMNIAAALDCQGVELPYADFDLVDDL
jgi:hypothetical protein